MYLSRSLRCLPRTSSFQGNNFNQTRQVGLVVGAFDSEGDDCTKLSPAALRLDDKLDGKLREALNGVPRGMGKLGRVTVLSGVTGEFSQIAVAGLGNEGVDFNQIEYLDEGRENVRIAMGIGARELQMMGNKEILVEGYNKAEAAAEGATLGVWYHTDKEVETKVSLYEDGDAEDWQRGVTKAEAQNLARCLCETPPNFLTPKIFATRAKDLLCPYGVQVIARDIKWLQNMNFAALLTLGASSVESPTLLELNYCSDPEPTTKPYMFIGQGTTFESGGLCRRRCKDMMRADMASAAILLGVFKAVAGMRLPINLRAYIPLYENMLSGMSSRPGDVFRVKNKLLRTENTQNHSQIVMIEAMEHAVRKFPPELVIALGTASRNVQDTIGAASAVWARNDYMWDHINYAGAVTGDRMWRYPLFARFAKEITERTDVDVSNLGIGRLGEPNLIAAFFNYFADRDLDFTYIDVSGASDIANGYVHYLGENLMTGAPTRGLIQLLCHLNYCKEQVRKAVKKEARSDA